MSVTESQSVISEINEKEERRKENARIAGILLVVIAAEGREGRRVRNFCSNALGLDQDDITVATVNHSYQQSRLEFGPLGLEPSPGAFPLTLEEYVLQTELVQKAVELNQAGSELRQIL